MNTKEISKLAKRLDEVWLVPGYPYDAEIWPSGIKDSVLLLSYGARITVQSHGPRGYEPAHDWLDPRGTASIPVPGPPVPPDSLRAAVLEALAAGWSCSVDEVVAVSEFRGASYDSGPQRVIGKRGKKSVRLAVDVLRNPRKRPLR